MASWQPSLTGVEKLKAGASVGSNASSRPAETVRHAEDLIGGIAAAPRERALGESAKSVPGRVGGGATWTRTRKGEVHVHEDEDEDEDEHVHVLVFVLAEMEQGSSGME